MHCRCQASSVPSSRHSSPGRGALVVSRQYARAGAAEAHSDNAPIKSQPERPICTECHGLDLHGTPGSTPDLVIVAAYSRETFTRLLRDGVPLDKRQLGLMGQVALKRFRHLTDREIGDLYQYLAGLKPLS